MPRTRRRIVSNQCYEICFRAKRGLPFVAYQLIDFLLQCILARVQRDAKVILCHHIWNGSHCHIIVVAKDAQQCVNFYGELQKKITDALKRLLDLDQLSVWEANTMVALIADVDAAIDRIAYLYANPAQDDLEECIEMFPGLSSWKDFKRCMDGEVLSSTQESFPWIRLPSIPCLPAPTLTAQQDRRMVRLLRSRNRSVKHKLKHEPNAWMVCFGYTSKEDVSNLNSKILTELRSKEGQARDRREIEGKKVLGKKRLRSQPIMKPHKPKKKSRKIFVLSSKKELRIQLIKDFKRFCELCRECYQEWVQGNFKVDWPPGAFKPPLPPNYNVLTI